MCDAFLQNYSGAVNAFKSPSEDLVPGLVLFSGPNCTGNHYPRNTQTGGLIDLRDSDWVTKLSDGTYTKTNVRPGIATIFPGETAVQSFIIPFNIQKVRFFGEVDDGDVYSDFVGPYRASSTSNMNWQDYLSLDTPLNKAHRMNNITYVQILQMSDWLYDVHQMCMGKLRTLGPYKLTRYEQSGDRCDNFMKNEYCCKSCDGYETIDCGCYRDLEEVKERSQEVGVDLPVLCFGEHCASTNTYKSAGMLSKPCNITVCEQLIQETSANLSVISNSTDTILCSGHFFTSQGELLKAEDPAPLLGVTDSRSPHDENPFYVWIMLAVSGVLFGLVVYLMFSRGSSSNGNLDTIIQKLKQN
jgi:hypothetical protein